MEVMPVEPFFTAVPTKQPAASVRRISTVVAVAFALILASCGGSRPELVGPDGESQTDGTLPLADGSSSSTDGIGDTTNSDPGDGGVTTTALDSAVSTTSSVPADEPITLSQCLTVVGPGPWDVAIEPDTVLRRPCGRVASYHRIRFTNKTSAPVSFDLAGQTIAIEPAEAFTTEPMASLAEPGLVPIAAEPLQIISPWLVGPADDSLGSSELLLGKFGSIEIGMRPTDAESVIGGNGLAKIVDEECQLTYLLGDPYSPLITVRADAITAIQVYAPGQKTRSGIGVGSTEADIQTAYGENIVTEAAATGDPNQKLMIFVPSDDADKAHRIVFAIEGGIVTSLRTGVTESIVSAPGC